MQQVIRHTFSKSMPCLRQQLNLLTTYYRKRKITVMHNVTNTENKRFYCMHKFLLYQQLNSLLFCNIGDKR